MGGTVRDRVEALVDGYDNERISRAELVDQLAEYLGGSAEPSGSHSMFQTLGLNHVALAVSDVGAMAEFLGQHLGTTVIRQSESQGFLAAGANNFVGLFQRPHTGLDHVCFTVEGYEPEDALGRAKSAGLESHGVEDRVFFRGPDGIVFQVASTWGDYPR
jgi:catechol 2,3-dioxygenase-like lactoylglutathione lyase family enzyme